MKNIVLVNALNAGKLAEYKAFLADITSAHKADYSDMLQRYGLKNSTVHYYQLESVEFVVVIHDIEDYAYERLATWPTSIHPFDVWFKQQTKDFYNADSAKKLTHELLLSFNPF